MENDINIYKNYQQFRVPLNFKSGMPNHIVALVCKKCGSMVADVVVHDRWHRKVRFRND